LHYFSSLNNGIDKLKPVFSEENQRAWLALLLAWIAGFADAFGFLKLNQIFFSAISGNMVAVNTSLARRDWTEVAHRGCPIIFFVTGFFLGTILEKIASRLHVRRRFSIALAIEGALLLIFLLLGQFGMPSQNIASKAPTRFYVLVALLSGAMGIQTASLRRVRQGSINTPFVTGMLVQAVENIVGALFNIYDRYRNRLPDAPPDSAFKAIFFGGLWFCFAVGASCGGLGETLFNFPALLAPVGALLFIIVCDLRHPIYD
jgi:uncharacterized membrane protein YoaK (UPF0700 family)